MQCIPTAILAGYVLYLPSVHIIWYGLWLPRMVYGHSSNRNTLIVLSPAVGLFTFFKLNINDTFTFNLIYNALFFPLIYTYIHIYIICTYGFWMQRLPTLKCNRFFISLVILQLCRWKSLKTSHCFCASFFSWTAFYIIDLTVWTRNQCRLFLGHLQCLIFLPNL